jgi:hypothetical protein
MRTQKRTPTSKAPDTRAGGPLLCPECSRTFIIGPDFVSDITATGRAHPNSKRAEVRCQICGHVWWSKHPAALRLAQAALSVRRRR